MQDGKLWNLIFDIFQPPVLGPITPLAVAISVETSAGAFPFVTPIIAISLAYTNYIVKLHL